MKYITEVEINLPIDRVIELFDSPENMLQWMEGLQSFEHISGEPGQPGAKSLLKFKMGVQNLEIIETVIVRNLPDEFTGSYEIKGIFNIVRNQFVMLGPNKTRHVTYHEFKFKGLMNIIAPFMKGSLHKQSFKILQDFKKFAESTTV